MIKLNGAAQREFSFSAEPEVALHYFSNLNRVAYFLPHITVVEEYGPNELRVHYQSVELGAYTINIFADLQSELNSEERAIYINPLSNKAPVTAEATLNATGAQGYFSSVARFSTAGSSTHIDYRLKLEAQLPRPRGLRMMPGRVVNRIAKSISKGRVSEIADGFMSSAIGAFPVWLAQQMAVN